MYSIDLSGRTAVVTGASGDLGRTMARTLARAGADVAVHYFRNREMADLLAAEINGMGRRAFAVQADVSQESGVLSMRDRVEETLGVPYILVNNAMTQTPWLPLLEQSIESFEVQFRTCVLHNVLMAKAFLPGMICSGRGGRIIGINTECAMQNFETQSAYVAAKRGMDGVMRVLAKEIGEHGITVNQVAPGWTVSDRNRDITEADQPYIERVPLKRRGTDQDIANAVLFLASDLASYITGAYIPVCGGNVMPTI